MMSTSSQSYNQEIKSSKGPRIQTILSRLSPRNAPGLRRSTPHSYKRKRTKPKRFADEGIVDKLFEESEPNKKKTKICDDQVPKFNKERIPASYENKVIFFRPVLLKSRLIFMHGDKPAIKQEYENFWRKTVAAMKKIESGISFLLYKQLRKKRMRSLLKRFRSYSTLDTVVREGIRLGSPQRVFGTGILLPNVFETLLTGEKFNVFDKSKREYVAWKSICRMNKNTVRCTSKIHSRNKTESLWLSLLEQIQDNNMHASIQTMFETQYCSCQINRLHSAGNDPYYESFFTDGDLTSCIEEVNRHSFRKTIYLTFSDEIIGAITFCIKPLKFKSERIVFVEIIAFILSDLGCVFSCEGGVSFNIVISILLEELVILCYELKRIHRAPVLLVVSKHAFSTQGNRREWEFNNFQKYYFQSQSCFLVTLQDMQLNQKLRYLLTLATKYSMEYCHGFFAHDKESQYLFLHPTTTKKSLQSNTISVNIATLLQVSNSKASKVTSNLLIEKIRKLSAKPTSLFQVLSQKQLQLIKPTVKLPPNGFLNVPRGERACFLGLKEDNNLLDLTVDVKKGKSLLDLCRFTSSGATSREVESKTGTLKTLPNISKERSKMVNGTKQKEREEETFTPTRRIAISSLSWKTSFQILRKSQRRSKSFLRLKKYLRQKERNPQSLLRFKKNKKTQYGRKIKTEKLLSFQEYLKTEHRKYSNSAMNQKDSSSTIIDLT